MAFHFRLPLLQLFMAKMKHLLILGVLILGFHQAEAAITPLSVGIAPPVQFPTEEFTVTGLRISALWGHHRDLYGIDVGGIGNITNQTFTGMAISGIFNMTHGTTTILGLQLAGLANINTQKTTVLGLQVALGVNGNDAASSVAGMQIALANIGAFTNIYGAQLGLYNCALDVYGLQIGVVNVADSLHGVQIGLINFNHKGTIGVSPIINIGF